MDAAKSKSKKERKGGGGWENDEAFHFIAYVPVNGILWELDGLRRQPVRLGLSLHPFTLFIFRGNEFMMGRELCRWRMVTTCNSKNTRTN